MSQPLPTVNTDPFALDPAEAHGLRLFGLRSSPDARLFQHLLDVDLAGADLWPLSGLDIAAGLLGSQHAHELRHAQLAGRTGSSATWEEALSTSILDPARTMPTDLNTAGLHVLAGLFETPDRAPRVMHTPAWQDKQLNTALACWAELRHVAHVFTKEAHVYSGLSNITDSFHGYLEPYPDFYAGLGDLVSRLMNTAERCGLWQQLAGEEQPIAVGTWIEEHPRPSYKELKDQGVPVQEIQRMEDEYRQEIHRIQEAVSAHELRASENTMSEFLDLLARLEDLARRELAGLPQTPADGGLLRSMGTRLKRLGYNHNSMDIAETPMSCIIDVAHTRDQCLEVGVGRPRAVYVVVETGQRRQVCRGGISPYHEFVRLGARRLDDEQWRRLEATAGFESWLERRGTLLASRRLNRQEVGELLAMPPARNDRPWPAYGAIRHDGRSEQMNRFHGLTAGPEACDLLVAALTEPEGAAGAVVWAHEQLVRMPAGTPPLASLEELMRAYAGETTVWWASSWQLQTVILCLDHHGPEAAPLLGEVRRAVAAIPPDSPYGMRDHFEALLAEVTSHRDPSERAGR